MAVEDANTGRRPRVTFVILSLSPLLGMEAATVALANALTTDYEVQVVLLAGDESGVPPLGGDSVDITSWGASPYRTGSERSRCCGLSDTATNSTAT